ncbi:MAG: response regulator [Chroococcidiopsidaceae cyanobacterium CP_BM_ER_R8_30]|nr:response regulator [Chroococcidiopsidaceae cyanobacterium CP_BM_ER_R8_30]
MTKRILIVDDEEAIRELACACLEDLGGWETIVAASGREGLFKAAETPLDAILLDVSMPEMDGFHFFTELQDNPAIQAIPVILLTAKVLADDRAQFAQMGVAGVITKPFDPVELSEQVAEILGWSV